MILLWKMGVFQISIRNQGSSYCYDFAGYFPGFTLLLNLAIAWLTETLLPVESVIFRHEKIDPIHFSFSCFPVSGSFFPTGFQTPFA
jgi:hypothetical protein